MARADWKTALQALSIPTVTAPSLPAAATAWAVPTRALPPLRASWSTTLPTTTCIAGMALHGKTKALACRKSATPSTTSSTITLLTLGTGSTLVQPTTTPSLATRLMPVTVPTTTTHRLVQADSNRFNIIWLVLRPEPTTASLSTSPPTASVLGVSASNTCRSISMQEIMAT